MNKKLFGLLLVVASLFSVVSFVSCKDNDSDLYNEVLIKETQHYNELKNRIDAIESNLSNVDCEALKSLVETLKAELEALKAKLDGASLSELDSLINRIEGLVDRVSALESQMKLKGVTVHSVYTPSFGSFNSSVGLNSNILFGYYGEIATGDPDFGNKGLAGGSVYSKNMGTIYLSIDPLNVDFEGYDVNLVSSVGASAGVSMSPLA